VGRKAILLVVGRTKPHSISPIFVGNEWKENSTKIATSLEEHEQKVNAKHPTQSQEF
jgi:hypothetical protein